MSAGARLHWFVDALDPTIDRSVDRTAPDLDTVLAYLVDTARAAWPAIALDEQTFVRFVAERTTTLATLSRMPVADLYLACACSLGDSAALRAFETRHASDYDLALARLHLSASLADEVKQRVRVKLFTAANGRPRIVEYTGRGELRGWLRVTAAREALNMLRATRREVEDDDALVDLADGADPALDHMKAKYRTEFRRAVREAMENLTPRERNLLRQYYLDGLTFEKLATMYRVHLATVARWVDKARETLLENSRSILMAQLRVDLSEVESILRLIESQLEVSAVNLLEPAA